MYLALSFFADTLSFRQVLNYPPSPRLPFPPLVTIPHLPRGKSLVRLPFCTLLVTVHVTVTCIN